MPMLHVDHRAEVFDCAKGLNGDDVVDHDEGVGGMLKLAKMPVVLLLVGGVGGGRGGRRDRR